MVRPGGWARSGDSMILWDATDELDSRMIGINMMWMGIRGEVKQIARALTGVVSTRDLFDFDDICTEVGEEHRRCGTCQHACEVDDLDALERRRDSFWYTAVWRCSYLV
jgi:hypothetical protein